MNMAIDADDKKKLIALGGLAAVVLLILIYLFFFRGDSSTDVAEAPLTPPPGMPGGPGMPGDPGMPGEAPSEAPAASAGGTVTAVSLASLGEHRTDPFTPQYILPPSPPPPPLQLPRPEALPTPSGGYAGLPPAYPIGGYPATGNNPSTVMVGLPPIIIPRIKTVPTSPQEFEAPKIAGSSPLASPSSNKRLSGVIIGDSVHALLEVSNASGTETYVVQPGDTVAGIMILGIRRVEMGGKTVPRMLIRENGQERYVDLRASFNPQADQPVNNGMMPGIPGTFPGAPSILPAPNINPGEQVGRGANPFSVH